MESEGETGVSIPIILLVLQFSFCSMRESNKIPLMGEMVGVDTVVIPGVCEGTDIVTNFGCSLSLSRSAPVP